MARVLVVDQEAACQQLLQRILRRECDVCVASSAAAALEAPGGGRALRVDSV